MSELTTSSGALEVLQHAEYSALWCGGDVERSSSDLAQLAVEAPADKLCDGAEPAPRDAELTKQLSAMLDVMMAEHDRDLKANPMKITRFDEAALEL